MKNKRSIFYKFRCIPLGLSLGVWLLVVRADGADWQAEAMPEYNQLFQRTNGWIGADGDFTVALTNGLTLWLFSDTYIGQIRDGHRLHPAMIHNSAAWQQGTGPAGTQIQFFYGQSADGKPESLISPADGRGLFWLWAGAMARGKLILFLTQIEVGKSDSAFGFRQVGTWLGEVSNPLAPPPRWHVEQKKIPFATFGSEQSCSFGSAILQTNDYMYLYGTREKKGDDKKMILARIPEASLDDFSSWRFRAHDGWTTNLNEAESLCGGLASEYSVSWLPALQSYVLICTENGLSDKIVARTAPEPWGPWSAAALVYRCPDSGWDNGIFCYAAKAHPMISSGENELIVTYAANTFTQAQALNDARLYWPRFVRVKSPR